MSKSPLEGLGRIAEIAKSLSLVAGIIVSLVGLYRTKLEADRYLRTLRLNELPS